MKLDPREEDLLIDLVARASGDQLMAGLVRRVDVETKLLPSGQTRVRFRLPIRRVPDKRPYWARPETTRVPRVRDQLGDDRDV